MALSECVLDGDGDGDDDGDFCMNPQYVPLFKDFYTSPVLKAKEVSEKRRKNSWIFRIVAFVYGMKFDAPSVPLFTLFFFFFFTL